MGKNSDTCQAIAVPGHAIATPVAPVAPVVMDNAIFDNLSTTSSSKSLMMDELVVPFHAWGAFFDVHAGQSVKIEGPEDAS